MKNEAYYTSIFVFMLVVARPMMKPIGYLYDGSLYLAAFLTLFSAYLLFRDKSPLKSYGTTLLLGISMYYQYLSISDNPMISSDFYVLSIVMGIWAIFYASMIQGVISSSTFVLAIVAGTLLTHIVPALAPFLTDLDTYWFWRFGSYTHDTGDIIRWDYLTYPPKGHSVEGRWMVPVVMATSSLAMQNLGVSVKDVAMVISAISAALIALFSYYLIQEMFPSSPNRKLVGAAAAFFLFASNGLTMRAVATLAEDDAFGMALVVASFALMLRAYNRKSYFGAVIGGISYLILSIAWAGYEFMTIVTCIFMGVYAISRYLKGLDCADHLPYYGIAVLIAQAANPLITGRLEYNFPPTTLVMALGFGFGVPIVLELWRRLKSGETEGWIMKSPYAVGGIVMVGAILLLYNMQSSAVANNTDIPGLIMGILNLKATGILDLTTAEAKYVGFDMKQANDFFGVAFFLALISVPVVLYRIYKHAEPGSALALSMGALGVFMFFSMSRFGFAASVPVAIMGASFLLYFPTNKAEWNSLYIIIPVLSLAILPAYLPLTSAGFTSSAAIVPMHSGPGQDRYMWEPFFRWLENTTPPQTTVVSWWDYGHWITAETHRASVLDNTKADWRMVQNVAKLHVIETNETKALGLIEPYNRPDIFAIDWTMIPKSGAPHFIATSSFEPIEQGNWAGYGMCQFVKEYSTINKISEAGGTFNKESKLLFACNAYMEAIVITITNDKDISFGAMVSGGATVPLDAVMKQQPMAILGVASLRDIIYLAINQPDDNLLPTVRHLIIAPYLYDKEREQYYDYRNVMMTKLYLGDYANEYYALGLCKEDWCREAPNHMKYIKQIPEFTGLTKTSNGGYVKAWRIDWAAYDKDKGTYQATCEAAGGTYDILGGVEHCSAPKGGD